MVKEAESKIYKTNGRHYLYLPKDLITDSNFPIDINKRIIVKINGNKLTIENKTE
ncbi:MAG: hypothetical protein QXR63_01240 [Candidatus Bathyarchaeia archaeon]